MSHDPGCRVRIVLPPDVRTEAVFSECGRYRDELHHTWAPGDRILWAMMNPSGADASAADMTVAKTARMSRRLGFGGQMIGNACAYRATDKRRLLEVDDPVGPGNHAALLKMAREAAMIVVAHGQLPRGLQRHADAMVRLFAEAGHTLRVLRLSSGGVPVHPLARGRGFVPETTVPVLWQPAPTGAK